MTEFEPVIIQAAYRHSMDDTQALLHELSSPPITLRSISNSLPHATRKNTSKSIPSDEDTLCRGSKQYGSLPGNKLKRRTFDALPSDMVDFARQTSDVGSQSIPPRSLPSSSSQAHHLRLYGLPLTLEDCSVWACDRAGDRFVDIMFPCTSTQWIRGQPAHIEWHILDPKVTSLRIELLEQGNAATTVIAELAANNGLFSYSKVPWGMACGDQYFLRISSSEDPLRYTTTGLFTINTIL